MERPFERVYTVFDYWDGPRSGFADFDGVPHAYRSLFRDDLDDYDPRYHLWPTTAAIVELALEEHAIWRRWQAAFDAGEVPLSSHPALPGDAARHAEIHPVLAAARERPPENALRTTPEFRRTGDRPRTGWGPDELEVRWTPVDEDER